MPLLEDGQLKKELTAGELRGLYLLWGPEKYLVKRAAARVIRKAAGDRFPEFNRQEFTGESAVDSIADAVEALPVFAQHKCVSVSDWDPDDRDAVEWSKLQELLESIPETTTLVLWYPTREAGSSARWKKLLQLAGKHGGVVRYEHYSQSELRRMLVREAEKNGVALNREDAGLILDYAGEDLTRLLGELEKLTAYALGSVQPGQQASITAESIEALVPKSMETTVFRMGDAMLAGNYGQAYLLLDRLCTQNEEPIAILGALSACYLDMYRVSTAISSGKKAAGAADYGDYKGREFRLRNAERGVRKLSPQALRESLDILLAADLALKGDSRLPGRLVLEETVAKLLLAARGEGT